MIFQHVNLHKLPQILDSDADLQDGSLAGDRDGSTDAAQQKKIAYKVLNLMMMVQKYFYLTKVLMLLVLVELLEYNLSTAYDVTTLTLVH